MKHLFLIGTFIFTAVVGISAQDYLTADQVGGKVKKMYEQALDYNRAGQYQDALKALDQALEKTPEFIDAVLLRADLLLLLSRPAEAEKGFQEALRLAPQYNRLAYKLLGQAQMEQAKYAEAAVNFEEYLRTARLGEKDRLDVDRLLVNARFAAEAIAHPVPFQPESLGDSINTPLPEYLPSLTADEQFLVYTTRVDNRQEDLFVSEKKNGVWTKGRPLESLNTAFNESRPSISADGKLMVFVRDDRRGNFDLYYSEKGSLGWSEPKPIGPPVNTGAWESQPSLSADGRELYFAGDRPGGQGGLDIWVSRRRQDGSWGNPQNLGPTINTSQNEQAPFIHADGQTLYFMSKGHPGMGQYDLFLSRRQADESWGQPVNLGYPINTAGNEGALIVSLDGKTAYFDSDKLGPGGKFQDIGNADIFQFDLHPEIRPLPVTYVKAVVTDAETDQRLDAGVDFIELKTGSVFASSLTGSSGEFLVCLPAGRDYALHVSKKGYLFHSENFALADSSSLDKPYLMRIALSPIPPESEKPDRPLESKPVVLRNVFFETGSAALLPESIGELNHLKELLENHPSLRIRINGHTDDVGSEADNLTLSENRARAVYDWLVAQGIPADRLGFKGFGESSPIDSNDTEEGRRNNRRVEFEARR